MAPESTDSCSWCGTPVEREDGWRVAQLPGARRAAFCRLEHVVPWQIQGAHWEAGEPEEPGAFGADIEACARCGGPLGEVRVVAIRHRGQHRIQDAFCSVDHLAEWAKSGGRWR